MDQSFEQLGTTERPGGDALREAEIRAAQRHSTYKIGGVPRQRVRHGDAPGEQRETSARCVECGVAVGQYHVPGCAFETCPACGGPVIACDCWYGSTPT